ncbi:MAG: S-layer homology domain-containing protein [Anaerovoracaceae bacterium]
MNEKDWYYDQILIALHAGYLSGFTDGTFKPDDSLTRAQASAIFSRIIPTYEMHSETGIQGFTDYSDFSWAADAIAVSYNKGYLKGYPDNSMRPNGTLTRAEALTVVLRILDNENIVNDDFTASTKETYKDTIYTGTIIVKSGEQVVFDNSVLLGTLESKTTEKATKWELKNDTRVVNTKYAASGGSSGGGGGGGGGTTVQEVKLAAPAIHLVKSGDQYIVTGISSNEGTVVSEYKITVASESGESTGETETTVIDSVKVDSDGNYSAEIEVAKGTSKLTVTAQAVKARDTSSKKFLPSEVASKDYSAAPEVETVTASYETKVPTTDQYQTSVEWTLEESLTAADYAGGFEVQLYQVTTGGAQEVYTPYGSPVNVSSEELSHIFDGSLPAGTYCAGVVSKGGSDPLSFDSASVLSEAFTVEGKTPVEPSDPDNLSAPKLDVVESEDGSEVTLNIKNTQRDCGENCIGDYSITVKEKGSEGEPATVSKEPFEEGDLTSFDITSYVQDAAEYEISVVLKAGTDQPSGHHHKDSDPAEITVTRLGNPENVSIDAVAEAEENIAVVSWAGGLFHEKAVEYVITLTETTIDGTGDAPQGDPKTVTVAADQITPSNGRYSCDVTDEITEMFGSESGMKSFRAEVQAMGDKKVVLRSKSVKAGVTESDVYHARMNVVAAPQATDLTFDLTTAADKVSAIWTRAAWTDTENGVHPEENGYLLTVYKDGEKVADMPVSVGTGTISYDISKYIDASEKGTYTFGLVTKGYVTGNTSEETILVFASNEAKSADSAAGGSIESGPVTAPEISFAERKGDSTSYPVYLTDPAGSERPSDTARYRVTVTGTYQGATKEVTFETDQTSFDLTALNSGGTFAAPKPGDFMYRSENGNFYADNADYTVSAAAVPSNTALNTESEEVNKTDEFRLAELNNAALDPSITTVNGKTAVSWKEDVPGAAAYTVTVVLPNGDNFEGELNISGSQCDITEALKNGAGKYQVKVSAVPVEWSTVYKAGTSDLELTVLAAPENVEIAAEEDTAKVTWSEVADADSYSVVIKKDGTVVGDPVEIVDVTEYDITETIKANGAGSYTAEVTAVGNGSQFITSAPGVSAPFVVRQLQDAEDVALTADKDSVDVSWTKVEDADGYRVDVYVEDTLAKSYDVESGDQTSAEISDAITDEHRKADTALIVRAEVTALGSLANGTLTSENSGKGTLAQKAGILPSPSVTNEDGKIVQEGGKLLVKYALDDNSGAGVGVDAIEELVLTLKYTLEGAEKTVNIKLDKDIAASGAFDVTEHLEGANSYQATVKTVAKYSVLNAETETEATLEYQVKELPAPELKVTEDGNYLYWTPIELSDGKILDSGESFTVEVKDKQDGSWKSVSDDDSVFGIAGEDSGMPAGSVYIDLSKSPISLNDGVQKWFRVTASNDVDATYGSESSAEITVKKLYAAEDVALTAAEGEDVVKAFWTDDRNVAGQVAGYRVELLKKSDGDTEVVADETVVAADREYTFSAGAFDPAERAEYTVRVTVIGTHAEESAFYADSSAVTSDPALISGSVPSIVEDSARIYESDGKLWLEIGFAEDSDYSKVDKITLDSMAGGSATVDTKALEGMLDEDADKVTFDLSGVQATILANIGESWTSHITVHSVNPALNADTEADVTAEIEVTQLDAPEIAVNQDSDDPKKYTISWKAVEGATEYEVTYRVDNGTHGPVTVESDSDLNFTVPDMVSGKVYTITVTAKSDRPITLTDSMAEVSVSRLQAVDSVQINPENGMIQWKDSKNPAGAAAYNLYAMKLGTAGGKAYVSKAGTEISLGAEDLYPDFNSQEAASYRVVIRPTAASAEAVDGVYYMKSEAKMYSNIVNAGALPEVTDVTNVTPRGSELYVSFTEPLQDVLYDHISGYTLRLYNAADQLVYEKTQAKGTAEFDVTQTTEGQPADLAPGTYTAEITTDVADGFAGVSTSVTTEIEIEYAGRNTAENPVISVDTGNGQISWTPSEDVDYEASYSYDGGAGTVSGDLMIAEGVISADQFGKIPAGVDYTVTITVSDPTGTMDSNDQTITLHRLSAVTGVTVTEQGTVTFTEAGDTSDGTVAVSVNGTEVSEQSGAYTWITDAIRDGDRADYSAAVQVKGSATDDVYYIDSEVSESAVSQRAGMVPEITLGDAIESVDGKLVIRYSLPAEDSVLIDENGLKLTLKQDESQIEIDADTDEKCFDVTDFVQKNPGGYEAELTVPAANPVLNGEREQTKEFTFDKTPIAAPELTVDTANGIVSLDSGGRCFLYGSPDSGSDDDDSDSGRQG